MTSTIMDDHFMINHRPNMNEEVKLPQFDISNLLSWILPDLNNKLANLPPEMIGEIVSYLTINELLKFNRICRSFKEKLQPILRESLYRNVSLKIELTEDGVAKSQLSFFLRTILNQPKLASKVERFSIYWNGPEGMIPQFPKIKLPWPSSTDLDQAETFAIFAGCSSRWLGKLIAGYLDVVIGITIMSLQNLQHLRLPLAIQTSGSLLNMTLDIHAKSVNKLKTIDLTEDRQEIAHCYYTLIEHKCFWSALQFEGLKHVSGILPYKAWDDRLNTRSILDPLPMAASLQSLTIRRTNLRETILGQLLKQFPCLTELTYEYEFLKTYADQLDLPILGKSLHIASSTLKRFKIAVSTGRKERWEGVPFPTRNIKGLIGPFKEMRSLCYLEISPILLYGWTSISPTNLSYFLPENLQELRLRDDLVSQQQSEWDPSAMEQLLHDFLDDMQWKCTCPDLNRVDLFLSGLEDSDIDVSTTERKALRKVLDESNLQCSIILESGRHIPVAD
jgi:hypothetical protein